MGVDNADAKDSRTPMKTIGCAGGLKHKEPPNLMASETALSDKTQTSSFGGSTDDLCPVKITFRDGIWWTRRTWLEKCLAVVTSLLFVIAVVFISLFLVNYLKTRDAPDNVCLSDDCLQTAAYVTSSINASVNPCEDFFQFACGRWVDRHHIPADSSSVNNFKLITDDAIITLREALSEYNQNGVPEGIVKARSFFKSCENTDLLDAKGIQPLLDLFNSTGNNIFPIFNPNWTVTKLPLLSLIQNVERVGGLSYNPFIIMYVNADEKNALSNIISFSQTNLILPSRGMYLGDQNSSVLQNYTELTARLLTLLGAEPQVALKDASDIVNFEIQLANITEPPENLRDRERLYNKLTVKALKEKYPEFDWLVYLRRHFEQNNVKINITDDEEVVISAQNYYEKLFPLLNRTSDRTFLNYCMWRITYTLAGLLSKEMRQAKDQFRQMLLGVQRTEERWKTCISATDGSFPDAVGRLYVEQKFTPTAKIRMDAMISKLREAFKELVMELDWMSDVTKQAAIEKAEHMTYKIGFPEYLTNDTAVNMKTREYNITEDNYFGTVLGLSKYRRVKMLHNLRKPVDKSEWAFSAATVNAWYDPRKNEIVFPAGILHKPFFSEQFPDSLNFGCIGTVIGHEITHGFDDSGRGFDKSGNLQQWWTEEDLQQFKIKTQCMVDQYNGFKDLVLNMSVNGLLTLGENIADNAGLKQSYRAYRKMIAKRGEEEPRLPALSYTQDQLFFIGFAQAWCSTARDQARRIMLSSDYHSPMQFRVLGSLQNNDDFARAFHCPAGSTMNPKQKCSVW